jgi:hypothetical protein
VIIRTFLIMEGLKALYRERARGPLPGFYPEEKMEADTQLPSEFSDGFSGVPKRVFLLIF